MNGTFNREKLAKVLAMAGSQHDGERANAAALADRMVKAAGLTWDRVLAVGGGASRQTFNTGHHSAYQAGFDAGVKAAARGAAAEQRSGEQRWDEFAEANPELAAWITKGAKRGLEFAKSLRAGVCKFGSLTERQEAAVRRNIAREKEASVW